MRYGPRWNTRSPIRPFALEGDFHRTTPFKTRATHTHAIAHGPTIFHNQIHAALSGGDHDRAGRVGSVERHDLTGDRLDLRLRRGDFTPAQRFDDLAVPLTVTAVHDTSRVVTPAVTVGIPTAGTTTVDAVTVADAGAVASGFDATT